MTTELTIGQVVDEMDLHPTRGDMLSCPKHEDNTPSLKLYRDSFYCFSCGVNGDAYGLEALYSGKNVRTVLAARRKGQAPRSRHAVTRHELDRNLRARWREMWREWWGVLSHAYEHAPESVFMARVAFWSDLQDEFRDRLDGVYEDGEPSPFEAEKIMAEVAETLERARPLEEREHERYRQYDNVVRRRKTPLV